MEAEGACELIFDFLEDKLSYSEVQAFAGLLTAYSGAVLIDYARMKLKTDRLGIETRADSYDETRDVSLSLFDYRPSGGSC
jgi:hypothetical protein